MSVVRLAGATDARRGVIVLLVLVALAWGGVWRGSFQYDDFPNLLNDPATQGGDALWQRLTQGIRPLTRLSHVFDNAIWGAQAGGWLLGNLLLHALTVAGVYWLARVRFRSAGAAMVASALFAVQPAHGMTVAYVSGRAAGLMTFLLVASLLAYEHAATGQRARQFWQWVALACFALACMAKEVALCFPLLLLLWEASRERSSGQTRLNAVLPFAMLAVLAGLVLRFNPRYAQLLNHSLDLRTPAESLRLNALALPATLSLLLRPWDLAVVHGVPQSPLWLVGWLPVAWACWRRRPWMLLALLWPVATLLPSHSLVAKADPVSESGLYLCWLGPALAAGGWTRTWKPAFWPRALTVIAACALAATCMWRVHVWSDPVRLWREALDSAPPTVRVWNNLGVAYMAAGESASARASFDAALRLDPANVRALTNRQMLDLVN